MRQQTHLHHHRCRVNFDETQTQRQERLRTLIFLQEIDRRALKKSCFHGISECHQLLRACFVSCLCRGSSSTSFLISSTFPLSTLRFA
jgi:hypothetical protein